jgi:GntR family transcriptional regulator/MocR family aminotransferase
MAPRYVPVGSLPRSAFVASAGTTSPATAASRGPELLIELRRDDERPLRAQLEDELRAGVRSGRLVAGTRMPSSRTLARDLAVSRRLVVEAYAQLTAEGYLVARSGSGTYVAAGGGANSAGGAADSTGGTAPRRGAAERPAPPPRHDFFPGAPDLTAFPRQAWQRALRDVLRTLPHTALGYPDPRGAPALREQLAEYLGRVRGVAAEPAQIVIVSGVTQGLALLASVLAADGATRIAVEDPSLPSHRAVLERHGATLVPVPVDAEGIRVDGVVASGVDAVLVTPAHQMPLGAALSVERRAALLAWDGLVIEDDYDAEFRYDRAPLGALQGLAPARVAYTGSVSKTLAPGIRLGWIVLPHPLADAVADAKLHADAGSDVLAQHVLARLIETRAYDRHLRVLRRRHRARREAFVAALARHLPGARPEGIAAGLHSVVTLPRPIDVAAFERACARRGVRVSGARPDRLVLGYASIAPPAMDEATAQLAAALAEASLA